MRPCAAIVRRSIANLAVGCSLLAFACGGSSKLQSGTGGAGGVTGTGGATTALPDAAIGNTGGTTPGLGGTSTATSTQPTGGTIGAGGARTGGATSSTPPVSGGTTVLGGSDAGQRSSGGRTGAGGTVASGGRSGGSGGASASGAAPAAGGSTSTSGGAGVQPDAAAGRGAGGTGSGGTGGGGNGTGGGTGSNAAPSAGCGNKAFPASNRYTIDVGGTSREYILKIPDNYDTNHPYRLIFGFHGAKYNDDWVATGKAPDDGTPLSGPYFGIESEAAGSTIFVAPQAKPTWGSSDLTFVDTMLAQFEAELCIDKSRVFSVGFSMGAIMTITLACNRSDVFRGVAPMSGSLPSPCPTGQHIAYWASHGTNDTTIRPTEGQAARDEFVKRNHCGTQTSAPDANNCITYQGCDQGYPVAWCTFSGGHDPAPFAGPAIWKFLEPL